MTLALVVFATLVLIFGFVVAFGAPYVPSKPKAVRQAFQDLYKLNARDTVVDIGSGDGLVLRAVSKLGAKAVGYEINPVLVLLSKLLSRGDPNVSIHMANFWNAEFPQRTTIVYTFGDSRDIKRMANKVQTEATRLHKTLYFISYGIEAPTLTPVRSLDAHFLYEVPPLHQTRA